MDFLVTVRAVHFAALLLAAGTIWFPPTTGPLPPRLDGRLRAVTALALTVTILSGAAWLILTAMDILDVAPAGLTPAGVWSVIADTRFGRVTGARLTLAFMLLGLLPWLRARMARAVLALVLVVLPAFTGHAGAVPGWAGWGWIVADMIHWVAAAAWLGGLPAFALLLASDLAGAPLVRAVRRYAGVALASVAALVASGLVNTWHLLGGPVDLIATTYGRLLSLKLALFAAMLALAAVNRLRLTPALPTPAARRQLMRHALGETALGLGIVLLVAILGITPPGGHTHGAGGVPDDAAFVHIHDARAMADVTLEPGRVGTASVTIRVMREDMSEFPARDVRLALDPPKDAARPSTEHGAVRQSDGAWRIDAVELPLAGAWTLRVTVMPATGSTFMLDGPVAIAP